VHQRGDRAEHEVHERPTQHYQEFLPARAQLVELILRYRLGGIVCSLEAGVRFVTVELYVSPKRDGADPVIRMPSAKTPDARPEAEEGVRLNPHLKKLSDDEMPEFMDVHGDSEHH